MLNKACENCKHINHNTGLCHAPVPAWVSEQLSPPANKVSNPDEYPANDYNIELGGKCLLFVSR